MSNSDPYSPDAFPSGLMVTDNKRNIVYTNAYFSNELSWSPDILIGKSSDELFTHSSKIFCESYLMPLLLHEGKCEEMQLALLDGNGLRIPILVNAKMDDGGNVYWSFFNASKRDKLYEELLQARKKLEAHSQKLKSLSETDELTGLLNRRELNKQVPLLLNQAKRYQQPIALFIIDIDFFKKINDVSGHLEGDRILSELGKLLNRFVRQSDVIARYGGEEFVMVLPNTDVSEASIITQRLHQLVAEIAIKQSSLTISIGATISDGNQSFHELTKQADSALYQAKSAGRNRTIFYQPS